MDPNLDVVCPEKEDHFCIGHNNDIYKLDNNLDCTKTYTDSDNKIVIFIRDEYGYKEYSNEDQVTSSSRFILYECLAIGNIQSGCTTLGKDAYIDSVNDNIFIYQSDDNQFAQLINGKYYDEENEQYYKCDQNGQCSTFTYEGYYLAGTEIGTNTYDKLIRCTSTKCFPPSQPTVDGYYINGEDNGASLIKCLNSGTSPSCSVYLTSTQFKTTGYAYLDAGHLDSINTEYGGVIICSSNKCVPKSKPNSDSVINYYLNGESNNGNQIIQCDSNNCQLNNVDVTKGYAYVYGAMENYILLGDDSKLNVIASSATSTFSEHYIDGSNPEYIITCRLDTNKNKIECSSGLSGATSSNKIYYIDNGISGNIIECSDEKCQSNSAKIGHYINGNSNNDYPLIQCNKGNNNVISCKTVSKDEIITGYYLNISSTSDNKSFSSIIYCNSSKKCSKITLMIKGYYIDASSISTSQTITYSKLIYCDGTDYKYVNTIQIGYYLNGGSSSNGSDYSNIIYCLDSNSCSEVTTKIKGLYIDASSTTDNNIYTKLIIYDGLKYSSFSSLKKGFYFNGSSSLDGLNYKEIIKCSSSTSCTLQNKSIQGYYVDGTSTNDENIYSKLIQYDGNSYSSVTNINVGYYLDGSSSTNNIEFSNIIKCTDSTTCTPNTSNNEGFYMDGSSFKTDYYTKLIKWDNSKYVIVDTTNVGYYLDGSSTSNGKNFSSIIYCSDLNHCSKITRMVKGYYLDGNSVTLSSSRKRSQTITYSKLIICDGSEYKSYSSTIHIGYYLDGGSSTDSINYNHVIYCSSDSICSLITTSIMGFYLDATSTTDNENYSQLISCNGETYTLNTTNKIGYYLDGSSSIDNVNYNNVINCSSATTCSLVEKKNVNNGYYMDVSSVENSKKLIKCSSSSCQLILSEGSEDKTAYYINGENNNYLIECDDQQCISIKNDSLLIVLSNRDDENEKIIVCDTQCNYISENKECETSNDVGNISYQSGIIDVCMESMEESISWMTIRLDNKVHYYLLPSNVFNLILKNGNIDIENILIMSTESNTMELIPSKY